MSFAARQANRDIFQRLPETFDAAALLDIALTLGLGPERRQVGLNSRPGALDPLTDARGRLRESESEFTVLNERFAGTYAEEVYRALPLPVGRVRFMWMAPRTCYSFHTDREPRLHIALQTNPDARLLIESKPDLYRSLHIPADGSLWWVNTRKRHTAANGGLEPRIHLVATILVDEITNPA